MNPGYFQWDNLPGGGFNPAPPNFPGVVPTGDLSGLKGLEEFLVTAKRIRPNPPPQQSQIVPIAAVPKRIPPKVPSPAPAPPPDRRRPPPPKRPPARPRRPPGRKSPPFNPKLPGRVFRGPGPLSKLINALFRFSPFALFFYPRSTGGGDTLPPGFSPLYLLPPLPGSPNDSTRSVEPYSIGDFGPVGNPVDLLQPTALPTYGNIPIGSPNFPENPLAPDAFAPPGLRVEPTLSPNAFPTPDVGPFSFPVSQPLTQPLTNPFSVPVPAPVPVPALRPNPLTNPYPLTDPLPLPKPLTPPKPRGLPSVPKVPVEPIVGSLTPVPDIGPVPKEELNPDQKCKCPTKKKKKERKSREICYRGTYMQRSKGIKYTPKGQVPCQ